MIATRLTKLNGVWYRIGETLPEAGESPGSAGSAGSADFTEVEKFIEHYKLDPSISLNKFRLEEIKKYAESLGVEVGGEDTKREIITKIIER